jgi:hypothetical protein
MGDARKAKVKGARAAVLKLAEEEVFNQNFDYRRCPCLLPLLHEFCLAGWEACKP